MAVGRSQELVVAAARLKREDCNETKHDSDFSKWMVLIGPSDWADYSVGKEGSARYRVHNLPSTSSAGVYELGISVRGSGSGREVGKRDILVVYLGQAENIRTRLRRYGQTGAHLGSSYSTGHWDGFKTETLRKSAGLFEDIFSRGHSIVFRWAAMEDKRAAEKTESQLLQTFDYAWNRGGNGARRPGEIVHKLDRIASSTAAGGIKIKASSNPCSPVKSESNSGQNDDKNFLFQFNRSSAGLVSDKCEVPEGKKYGNTVCGFIMADAILCISSPVAGRKRCLQHKGMRICGSNHVKSSQEETDSNRSPKNWECSLFGTVCGATLVNGSLCRRSGQGNERCWQHQEKRVGNGDGDGDALSISSGREGLMLKFEVEGAVAICGVWLLDGSACSRAPVAGRKRCLQHKGMRIYGSNHVKSSQEKVDSNRSPSWECSLSGTICGATLVNGSFCRRPGQGNERCWQHQEKKVGNGAADVDALSISSGGEGLLLKFEVEGAVATCGVWLLDGSACSRAPVAGRKRCLQHKGMRVK